MDHYQLRFKTIPDENKEELARTIVGMFPYVLDSLCCAGEDADIRNAIKDCFETLEKVEKVLTELGMQE